MDQSAPVYSIDQIANAMRLCRIGYEYRQDVIKVLTNQKPVVELVEPTPEQPKNVV